MDLLDLIERSTAKNFKETPADCSAEAASSNQAMKAKVRREVLAALRVKPMSACELAEMLGYDICSVRPRLSDLVHDELVEKLKGERRKTPSNKSEAVWQVAGEGA